MSISHIDEEMISALRVDTWECIEDHPYSIIDKEKPEFGTRIAWIPQTIADQIWVLYKFSTVGDRIAWETTLSDRVKRWLDRKVIRYAISFDDGDTR